MEDKPIPLGPTVLLVDLKSPRLPEAVNGQREAFCEIAKRQNDKILVLADHIVRYGRLHPAELPLVMKSQEQADRFVVLEGNRRLTALKCLESPEMFVGSLSPGVLDRIRKLSVEYHKAPIQEIYCILMDDRDEADPWIALRHYGENGGAGVVPWGADEKDRYNARRGAPAKLHTRLLDHLQAGGHLSLADRERISTTTLERLLKSDQLCSDLGIEKEPHGEFKIIGDEGRTIHALLRLIRQLMDGHLPVRKVYMKEDRDRWVETFAATLPAKKAKLKMPAPVSPQAVSGGTRGTATSKYQPVARIPKPRERLIPSTCLLGVRDARIRGIEVELRTLDLEQFPNAISILFRVFIELTIDWYLQQNPEFD